MKTKFKDIISEITQKDLIDRAKELSNDLGNEDLTQQEKMKIQNLLDKINKVLDFEHKT